jgi:hypothetical protein
MIQMNLMNHLILNYLMNHLIRLFQKNLKYHLHH